MRPFLLHLIPGFRGFASSALGAFAACLAASAAGAAPETADLDPGVERAEIESVPVSGPLVLFAAVEEAWLRGDARALMEMLDPQEKVGLSFRQGGPRGGWFNRDQAYFLLKDQLAFHRAERFEFEKYWNLDSDGRSPYAVAVHSFRISGGAAHTDRIYISLRRRDDQWVVGEIRSLGS